MTNFIQKHKIFFVLLLALITLSLGFIFVQNDKKTTEADDKTITVTLQCYWSNTSSIATNNGVYTSEDGNVRNSSVGTAYFEFTDLAGGTTNATNNKISCSVGRSGSITSKTIRWSKNVTIGNPVTVKYKGWIEPASGFKMVPDPSLSESIEGEFELNWLSTSPSGTIPCYFCPRSYTITYNANGGIVNENILANSDRNDASVELKDNSVETKAIINPVKFTQTVAGQVFMENYIMPDHPVERTGYIFSGYYTAPSGGERAVYMREAEWTTLYAHWTPKTYTVTWDANGGNSNTTTTCTYDANYVLPANPTKDGYRFTGWNTSADGTGTTITSSTLYTSTSDSTVYAQWEKIRFTLNLDRKGGSGGNTSIPVTVGQSVGVISVPSKTGYTFGGYYSSTNGTGLQILSSSGVFINGNPYSDSSGKWSYYGDVTVYAKWTANAYKVSIYSNGGYVDMTNPNGWRYSGSSGVFYKNITYDTEYGTLPTCTRTGYEFSCYGYNGNIITSTTKMTTAQAHMLTAFWTANTYTISYNANGGSGTMSDISMTYDVSKTLTSNTFTRANYVFTGWNTKADGSGTTYKDCAYVINLTATNGATVPLYAQWVETWANKGARPSGSGTQIDPYLISTPQHLGWIANQTNTSTSFGGYFKQIANIDLTTSTKWNPIGTDQHKFIGNYDGNGYVIKNLNIENVTNASGSYIYYYQGLFGYIHSATIKNVNVLSGNIYGYDAVGGIIGKAVEGAVITNCQSSPNIYGGVCGGIVGVAENIQINGCFSTSNLQGGGIVGGIVGWSDNTSTIINSCGFQGTLANTNANIMLGGGSVAIVDCFGIVSSSNNFAPSGTSITSSLYISGSTKKYFASGDFSNWTIPSWINSSTFNATPIPRGISWLAVASGEKISSYTQLESFGYTKV